MDFGGLAETGTVVRLAIQNIFRPTCVM